MKTTPKYVSHLGAAILVISSAAIMAPVSRAQAPAVTQAAGDSSGASAAPATTGVPSQASESSSTDPVQIASTAAPAPEQQSAPASTSSAPASAPQDTSAETPATPPAAPMPLPNPTMTAPLATAAPAHTFDAGPFGTLSVTGILSGIGMVQDNWITGDKSSHWDVSNAQVFLQKTTGWWQFYLQGGAYNLPDLGAPFIDTNKALSYLYGPLPVAYLKLVKGGFSVQVGELPTLIGAEYTFDFEKLNIERGLLWNQESAISRGIQLNEAYKKLSLSVSWNDGFYSNRYTWLTGSLAYAFNSANTLAFVAGGNAGATGYSTFATPVQNNSAIYEVLYTYTKGNWYVQPYWQYTNVPTNARIGITKGASTDGLALLFNYNFKHGISLALRPEYISSSGSLANGAVNLLYGPGSNAFSFTVTPTYQKGGFFARADLSVVDARSYTPGDAFGYLGTKGTQTRGVIEAGFMF